MKDPIKIATAVVVLIVTIAGALYAYDNIYLRKEVFVHFAKDYYYDRAQDALFKVNERIYETEDMARKRPNDDFIRKRLQELYMEKEKIKEQIKRLEKQGG